MFFREQPDKMLGASGIISEGAFMGVMVAPPAIAALEDKGVLVLFLLLYLVFQAALYHVSCGKCAIYSREPWKSDVCPNCRLARALNGILGRQE
ncbi:MAG: hypothetical protein SWK76_09325 [Actinomycetota bacterium]|nr:hypothetical protein [Actinomycetota bacterium]